jgi:hypothetical protein
MLWVRSFRLGENYVYKYYVAATTRGCLTLHKWNTYDEWFSGYSSRPAELVSLGDFAQEPILWFHYHTSREGCGVLLPFWSLLALFITTATIPWIRWRFTLRALLIATTLVAVVLGVAVYALR